MKKTIAVVALAVSASSGYAFIGNPPPGMQIKNYCVDVTSTADGSTVLGTCDQSRNNQQLGRQLGSNGCTDTQASLQTYKRPSQAGYPITIGSCLPPNAVQL